MRQVVDETRKNITDAKDRVESMKPSTLNELQEPVDTALGEMEAVIEDMREMHEALAYMCGKTVEAKRKVTQQVRYLRTKVINKLISQGHGAALAKALANRLESLSNHDSEPIASGDGVAAGGSAGSGQAGKTADGDEVGDVATPSALRDDDDNDNRSKKKARAEKLCAEPAPGSNMVLTNPEKLDSTKFVVWTVGAAPGGCKMAKKVADIMGKCDVVERAATLTEKLKQQEKWVGAMTKTTVALPEVGKWALGVEPEEKDNLGAVPWLSASRSHGLRFGPRAMPLPGYGSIVMQHGKDQTMYIVAFQVSSFIGLGICIGDLLNFLETDAGWKFMQDGGMVVFNLPVGACAWLPYGWVGCPLYISDEGAPEDLGFLWVWTVFVDKWKKEMQAGAATALRAWNKDYLETVKTSRQFEARHAWFERIG